MAFNRDKRMKLREQFLQRKSGVTPGDPQMDMPQGECDHITNRLAKLKCQLKSRKFRRDHRPVDFETAEERHNRLFPQRDNQNNMQKNKWREVKNDPVITQQNEGDLDRERMAAQSNYRQRTRRRNSALDAAKASILDLL